ncbi:peptidase [Fulvivirga sp. M361]|uniref:ATP-dependent zinc protease family protein n=1 Tax=Fulvivirga sp. M361 TaxID=2594266 RepID=UPI00117B0061|nr:RimK/LysX family protein [Fulvivirga sp. M361]TRX60544.1 peptidase [Fulvivirga sp. M361]
MIVIGRKDRIDLPEFDLFDIPAKVDTGAYGSALHCHYIEIVERGDEEVLVFKVLDPSHPEYEDKTFYIENFNDKQVKSSSGEIEHRYTIRTVAIVFGEEITIEFSLTNRGSMKYPILLGRKFLSKQFLVDVKLKDLSFQLKKQKT